jgi:hypothetical protein
MTQTLYAHMNKRNKKNPFIDCAAINNKVLTYVNIQEYHYVLSEKDNRKITTMWYHSHKNTKKYICVHCEENGIMSLM